MVAVEFVEAQLAQGGEQGPQGAAGLIRRNEVFVVAPIWSVFPKHAPPLAMGGIMSTRWVDAGVG